jgi:hypothetical protein
MAYSYHGYPVVSKENICPRPGGAYRLPPVCQEVMTAHKNIFKKVLTSALQCETIQSMEEHAREKELTDSPQDVVG